VVAEANHFSDPLLAILLLRAAAVAKSRHRSGETQPSHRVMLTSHELPRLVDRV
jgi:hypothetical protein